MRDTLNHDLEKISEWGNVNRFDISNRIRYKMGDFLLQILVVLAPAFSKQNVKECTRYAVILPKIFVIANCLGDCMLSIVTEDIVLFSVTLQRRIWA